MDALPQHNKPTASSRTAAVAPTQGGGIVTQAIQTWLRYLVPLTLLSLIALSPVIVIALGTRVPLDAAAAAATQMRGWAILALAVFCQLVLVGGASAITRAEPSQLRALGGGIAQLVRAIVPCLAAAAAIAIGGLALAVPGLVLLALLALTGASPERGVPAALLDSIAVARTQLPTVALAVAGMIALDVAIGLVAYRLFAAPLPRHPAPAQLAAVRHFVHAIGFAVAVASPVPATLLATIRTRAERAAGH